MEVKQKKPFLSCLCFILIELENGMVWIFKKGPGMGTLGDWTSSAVIVTWTALWLSFLICNLSWLNAILLEAGPSSQVAYTSMYKKWPLHSSSLPSACPTLQGKAQFIIPILLLDPI